MTTAHRHAASDASRHKHATAAIDVRHVSTHRLSEALFVIRRRRSLEPADVLLEECLTLLDAIAERTPMQRVAAHSTSARARAMPSIQSDHSIDGIVGQSAAMQRLRTDVEMIARHPNVPALIVGEPGTGKEQVARTIHRMSAHPTAPFIIVDSRTESSFVAGVSVGTIFLDGVGELSLELQAAVIRAFDRQGEPGGDARMPLGLRVVAASDTDLDVERQRGRVRADLYYRLKPFEFVVPPLRQRSEADLREIVETILMKLSARGGGRLVALASDVWERFARYAWPGNVRELGSVLERMVVAAGAEALVTVDHLPDYFRRSIDAAGRPPGVSDISTRRGPSSSMPDTAVQGALARNDYKHGRTATELGISRHQLYRLLKRSATREALAGRAIG